jgi:AraC-like DNA-binding protein
VAQLVPLPRAPPIWTVASSSFRRKTFPNRTASRLGASITAVSCCAPTSSRHATRRSARSGPLATRGRSHRPLRGRASALNLLTNYASYLLHSEGALDQQLLNLSVRHLKDLLALAIDDAPGFAETARSRGLRAARLKLAKSYVITHSERRDVSIGSVAANLHVAPRYLQRLFEADGTTFSEFLIRQRLARAHQLLSDPNAQKLAISSIAYDVGFGDLSYFNRRFRRQYGLTPGEVRHEKN